MTDFTLVRTDEPALSDAELGPVRRFLTKCIDGLTDSDRKAWHRLWKRIRSLEPGEMLSVEFVFPRCGPFHRRWMVFETALFESQERFTNRDTMRDWIKIASGYCEWCPGAKGGIVPIPKSISYAKADQGDFEVFVDGAVEFAKTEHFANFLWKHAPAESRAAIQDDLIGPYEVWLAGPGLEHRTIKDVAA